MESTRKYANLSALKWSDEDLDGNVNRLLENGEITTETAAKFIAMTQQEKIEFIEEAIVYGIEDTLMELINDAIIIAITQENK
jgi:hypothetical protein